MFLWCILVLLSVLFTAAVIVYAALVVGARCEREMHAEPEKRRTAPVVCPTCGETLKREPAKGFADVIIARCPKGHGIWLEY